MSSTTLLEEFVTDEVSERIDERRKKVADIWGTGTTRSQESEVREFYREVKALLSDALEQHLRGRAADFSGFLVIEAEGAPRDALDEVQILLEQASDNIRAAATALIAGQKETAQALVAAIVDDFKVVLVQAEELLQVKAIALDASMKLGAVDMVPVKEDLRPSEEEVIASSGASAKDTAQSAEIAISNGQAGPIDQSVDDESWFERVQSEATVAVNRMRLTDGTTGWPFEKIFHEAWIKGALRIRLIDPFLAQPHQIRNLREFLLHIAEVCRPKKIEVITSFNSLELTSNQDRALDDYANDLFKSYGVSLSLTRTEGLHDRYLILGHGVVFKLGRGLDIYKPATGLAAHRPANRRVRETGIDVFAVPASPLVSQR